jgi:uncharacterized protein (DUF3084 family)
MSGTQQTPPVAQGRAWKLADVVSLALFLFTILSSGCAIVWKLAEESSQIANQEIRLDHTSEQLEMRSSETPELADHERRLQTLENEFQNQGEAIQTSLGKLSNDMSSVKQKVDDLASRQSPTE